MKDIPISVTCFIPFTVRFGGLYPLGKVIEIVDSFRPLFVLSNVSPNMDTEGEAGNRKSDFVSII
jgi:hypothetical protein